MLSLDLQSTLKRLIIVQKSTQRKQAKMFTSRPESTELALSAPHISRTFGGSLEHLGILLRLQWALSHKRCPQMCVQERKPKGHYSTDQGLSTVSTGFLLFGPSYNFHFRCVCLYVLVKCFLSGTVMLASFLQLSTTLLFLLSIFLNRTETLSPFSPWMFLIARMCGNSCSKLSVCFATCILQFECNCFSLLTFSTGNSNVSLCWH